MVSEAEVVTCLAGSLPMQTSQSFLVGLAKTPTTVEPMILFEKLAEELPRNPSRLVLLGVGLSVSNEAPP